MTICHYYQRGSCKFGGMSTEPLSDLLQTDIAQTDARTNILVASATAVMRLVVEIGVGSMPSVVEIATDHQVAVHLAVRTSEAMFRCIKRRSQIYMLKVGMGIANIRPGNRSEAPRFNLNKDDIKTDLSSQRPIYPFSCYGPSRDAPRQLMEGPVEISPEELRLRYYSQRASGNESVAVRNNSTSCDDASNI